MLKHKSIIFLFVSSFTISNMLWAVPEADLGNDTSISADMGPEDDMGTQDMASSDTGEDQGPEKSTPLDPDYSPEVTSSTECTCRSIQTKSSFGWLPVLLIGGIFGFSRRRWKNSEKSKR